MRVVHLLTSGVDTIHASAPGALRPGLRQELGELRGQTGADGSMVDLGDNPEGFILKPHGWRGYPIWLRSARIELMLGAVDPFPPVFVQWHSPFIHAYGVETAVAMVEGWLDEAVMEVRGPLRASRLDLYCDFQGWIPTVRDLSDFSCRATRRRVFEVPRQAHLSGRSFSGFTFGKGDVVCRIYDKSLEMAGRDQHRQEEIWRGRDPEQPVWRVVMSSIAVSTRLVSHRGWASGWWLCLIPKLAAVQPTPSRPPSPLCGSDSEVRQLVAVT